MNVPEVFSSGFLVFRRESRRLQFLLMQHASRWDLPKGHLDDGESKLQAAFRELQEETSIPGEAIWRDPEFVFEHRYMVTYRRKSVVTQPRLKELTIYLGFLKTHCDVSTTEHQGFRWFDWKPPHQIQPETIDPLLEQVRQHFANATQWPPSSLISSSMESI